MRHPRRSVPGAIGLVLFLTACGGAGELSDPVAAPTDNGVLPDSGTLTDEMPSDEPGGDGGAVIDDGGPYPVVLAHGFFGFDDLGGAGVLSYFYGVREALTAEGYEVFTPTVDPFNDSTDRAAELLSKIQQILVETGAAKVNIIGHSQGGLDARAVAHLRPDLVASVTTYGTPNTALPLSDALGGAKLPFDPIYGIVDSILPVIGSPLWGDAVKEASLKDALHQLSSEGIEAFNAEYTDQPGVAYFSITGRTAWDRGDTVCFPADRPAFVQKWDSRIDTLDPLLALVEPVTAGGFGKNARTNDGLVRAEDARWGRFLGCVPADHFDEVGLLGDRAGITNDFDHIEFFQDLIDWLYVAGY